MFSEMLHHCSGISIVMDLPKQFLRELYESYMQNSFAAVLPEIVREGPGSRRDSCASGIYCARPYTFGFHLSDVGSGISVLGYPLRASMGDEIKLTNGIVCSKTGFQGDLTAYQLSAAVQPRNAGGPVIDEAGNIIGIINAKHSGAENPSYAIKASYLLKLLELSSIQLPSVNLIGDKSLTEQVKAIKDFIYIVEVQ